jgi:hypothetical protein
MTGTREVVRSAAGRAGSVLLALCSVFWACEGCKEQPPDVVLGELLVEGQFQGNALQVYEGRLYWAVRPFGTTGAIRTASLEGGAVSELARIDDVLRLRFADGQLYACGCEGVHRLDLPDGDLERLASADRCCDGVAVDGASAYWSDFTEGVLHRTDLASAETSLLVERQSGPAEVAADETAVYWMNWSDDPGTGGPFSIDKSGGEIRQLAVPAVPPDWPAEVGVRPAGLVLDDTHAYFALAAVRWSVLNRAAIVRVPKDGGSPIVLAEDSHYKVFDLAVDQTHVYWARTFDNSFDLRDGPGIPGAILRVPKDGGEVEVLADGQNGPQSVIVEGEYVYWINYASGNIRRVRKPQP